MDFLLIHARSAVRHGPFASRDYGAPDIPWPVPLEP